LRVERDLVAAKLLDYDIEHLSLRVEPEQAQPESPKAVVSELFSANEPDADQTFSGVYPLEGEIGSPDLVSLHGSRLLRQVLDFPGFELDDHHRSAVDNLCLMNVRNRFFPLGCGRIAI
jgi:hypothetical protein